MRRALLLLVVVLAVLLANVQAEQKHRVHHRSPPSTPEGEVVPEGESTEEVFDNAGAVPPASQEAVPQDEVVADDEEEEEEDESGEESQLSEEEYTSEEDLDEVPEVPLSEEGELDEDDEDVDEDDEDVDEDEEDVGEEKEAPVGVHVEVEQKDDTAYVSVQNVKGHCFITFADSRDHPIPAHHLSAKVDGKEVKLKLAATHHHSKEKIELKFDSKEAAQTFSSQFANCNSNPFAATTESEVATPEPEVEEETEVATPEPKVEETEEVATPEPKVEETEEVATPEPKVEKEETEEDETPSLLERLAARRRSVRSIRSVRKH